MKWSRHIDSIRSRANSVFDLIKRNLWNCPKSVKETAYMMLVRPKLQYACGAWDPYHQKYIAALERVQRKAARFVTENCDQTASVMSMLSELKWDSLESMRGRARLTTIYKLCYGMLEGNWGSYMISNRERRTRGSPALL